MLSPLLDDLARALATMPGIGRKTAQRLAIHLISQRPDAARGLVATLGTALDRIGHCQCCRNLTEEKLCGICRDTRRDDSVLCVVESPMDVVALEASGGFRGRYFVLFGRLSPIDGIGPDQLHFGQLESLVGEGVVREVILATNLTVEGEATAHYIAERLRTNEVKISRIAQGVPTGGELEYVDGQTLGLAIRGRAHY